MRVAAMLAVGLSLLGCSVGRQMGAGVAEHQLYRQSRVARTLEERLAAAQAYRNQYPDGVHVSEVEAWLEPAAADYFDRIRNDAAALRGYLSLLPPETATARQVSSRLDELQVQENYEAAREFEFEVSAAEIDCEFARAARQRQAVVDRVMLFVRQISAIRSWGEPTSSLDHEFIYEWRIRPPRARCVGRRCVKTVVIPYAIPEDRQLSPRVAVFDVVIELQGGGVSRAYLTGPELFSRLAEAVDLQSVAPDDDHARLDAMTTSLFVVQNAMEAALPAGACDRPPVSPVLIERQCRGVHAAMIAGRDASEEDRVVVEGIGTP